MHTLLSGMLNLIYSYLIIKNMVQCCAGFKNFSYWHIAHFTG